MRTINRVFTFLVVPSLLIAAATKEEVDIKRVTPLTLPGAQTFIYHDVQPEPMRLHVFPPKDLKKGERRAAFVFFFGGGWMRGTPSVVTPWMEAANGLGMIGIAPDYRVKERHGADPSKSVADARAALRWVQMHAEELGIDPQRIVVSGASAGGHVALWTALATTPWGSDPAEAPLAKPAGLVLVSAAVDTSAATGVLAERMAGHATELSPLHHLDPKMPPVMIIHGDQDKVVPFTQAAALDEKLRISGNDAELVPIKGSGHGVGRGKVVRAMEDFLKRRGILRE